MFSSKTFQVLQLIVKNLWLKSTHCKKIFLAFFQILGHLGLNGKKIFAINY